MTALGLGLGGALAPLGLPPTTTYTFSISADAVDGIGVADDILTTRGAPLSDDIGVTDLNGWTHTGFGVNETVRVGFWTPEVTYRYSKSLAETLGAHDALTHGWGVTVAQAFGLLHGQAATTTYGALLAQAVGVAERLRLGIPVTTAETVGMHLTQQLQLAVQVAEELGLALAHSADARYGLTQAEGIRLADTFYRFLAGSLSDGVGMAQVFSLSRATYNTLAETVGVGAIAAPTLSIRVTARDGVGIDDVDALKLIYSGVITEGLEVSIAYVAPNGSVTTWAVNTRTGATTEYQNYAFNSFAKLGDKYIGTASDGLYELLGNDDDGTDIIARIKSGFAQFAGSRFTMLKAAYLGVRGGGEYVLRLITGDGVTVDYGVVAEDMKTSKVALGKGLRARYFAFELISAGQDFDLDTVEFVPIVVERRV